MRRIRFLASAGCACLTAVALTACGSRAPAGPASPAGPALSAGPGPATRAEPGFAGYDWQVVAISHGGTRTSIPPRLRAHVYLLFSRSGRFGANDGINFHDGTYRAGGGGFTTSMLSVSAMGTVGHDPMIALTVNAIRAFDNGAHARVGLTGDRLVVEVGSYTLTCQRHGPAGRNA